MRQTFLIGRPTARLAIAAMLGALAVTSLSACATSTDDRTALVNGSMPPRDTGWAHTPNEPDWQSPVYRTIP